MPEPSDVVVVTNNESLPFTIKYNKREYKLTPGHPVFLPFEAACLWFGDPRSQGNIQCFHRSPISFISNCKTPFAVSLLPFTTRLATSRYKGSRCA